MAKEEKTVKKTAEELIKLLGIEGEVSVKADDESFNINLQTQDSGIVIGRHGDILEALQIILSLCISQKLGKFFRISLEVGDYKKNREEWLKSMAHEAKEKVISENKEIIVPALKAWERRIIHLLLKDDKEVVSESIGEGKERTLVVRPKN
ncbi:MAG: hypothetical protein A2958_01230 [Candidatus Levybacteria bacterium RIFCSPLOWO2_01_FULL_38_13]|nr:MAG: hypothetical protein A2629_01090 [Candidatus Levybacteria bacterium RIFCSPHIGHO2_01_FULL_41_15]OGH35777.1 MAG: hypothetical protein A2958_01230 [Candidatus Levybacteria bacterium RIFCSPLOWO2_01_FULL_38_13]